MTYFNIFYYLCSMIFYFSGTGNTRWVAKQLAEATGETLYFIPEEMRKGGHQDDPARNEFQKISSFHYLSLITQVCLLDPEVG